MNLIGCCLLMVSVLLMTYPARAETRGPAGNSVADANTRFACDLYAKLREKPGNVFFSPFSVSTALAMTQAGARGETAAQMQVVLGWAMMDQTVKLSEDQQRQAVAAAYAKLIGEVNGAGDDRPYQLSVANALWGQKGFEFEPAFIDLLQKNYAAGLNEVDYHQTEAARAIINTWVEKQTQEKIKDLIQPGMLSPVTLLTLTNAIYFKGDWETPFKKNDTSPGLFTVTPDKQVRKSMMHMKHQLPYFEDDTLQVLEMPYKGNALSMIVLLPKGDLSVMEKDLTPEKLTDWAGRTCAAEVTVTLPKYKVTQDFDLGQTLAEMGMPLAFDPGKADFSGISAKQPLYISKVIHKAFVAVDEKGTEAAAATAVLIAPGAMPAQQNILFTADHPFLFVIRHNATGSVLFMGRVTNPEEP